MGLNVQIKAKYNYSKLNKMVSELPKATAKGVKTALEKTAKHALRLKRGSNEGILIEMIDMTAQEVKGRVYTNFKHAMFLEFGTGTEAELPHIGTTKTFIESGYEYWYVPADEVDRPIGPLINIMGVDFYLARSQPARSFMRSTAFERRADNVNDVKKAIQEMLKEVIK